MTGGGSPFSPDDADARLRVRDTLFRMARTIAPYEPGIEERIRTLGFEGDAARAFDLLPLVLVAWADGSIQAAERAKILDVLRVRGLGGTEAYTMLAALLEERPADVYLDTALALLRDLLEERGGDVRSVVDLCIEVAAAASHIVGADPISPEEREAIERVAAALGDAAVAELRRRLG